MSRKRYAALWISSLMIGQSSSSLLGMHEWWQRGFVCLGVWLAVTHLAESRVERSNRQPMFPFWWKEPWR